MPYQRQEALNKGGKRKMKKKVISGLLVGLALVLTMTSCGDNSSNNKDRKSVG